LEHVPRETILQQLSLRGDEMTTTRTYSFLDDLIINLDNGFRTVFGKPRPTDRPPPDAELEDTELSTPERRMSEGFMRVNHSGEVCAQALYQGQALMARESAVKEKMAQSAEEENDHLTWCEQRVHELGGHTSYLNPVWYLGSFCIGALAGAVGDKWSLGFVAETEHQVVRHLEGHLSLFSPSDAKSRAIVEQMKADEAHHATVAIDTGAADLPVPIKTLMTLTSKVMTTAAYYL
jgi:ubiquinone biosynthesis monooxygenase Coq7